MDPAIAQLARELVNPTSRPADRLRAVETVVHRAGLPRGQEIRCGDEARELLLARLVTWRGQTIDGSLPRVEQDDQD